MQTLRRTSLAESTYRLVQRYRRFQSGLVVFLLTALLSIPVWAVSAVADAITTESTAPLATEFEREVSPRLVPPISESTAYASRLQSELNTAKLALQNDQFVVVIDRSPSVQAALVYWGSSPRGWALVGATPVSTSLPGRYEHFLTPLGLFDHTTANPDYRAEGTKNKLGFRGYGRKGMRVYDLGWVNSYRGWGKGGMGVLRLQMHATDPDLAEHKLGTPQSEGCIRISATLNDFIDRYGILDDDYERSAAGGKRLWVLRKDRTPTTYSGRYIVVIETSRTERPNWSPLPVKQ